MSRDFSKRPNQRDKDIYANFLRRRMSERKVTIVSLAEQVGVSPGAIKALRRGRSFPLPENAAKIADVLDSEHLITLSRIELKCPICGKTFYAGTRRERRFCSPRCTSTASNRARNEKRRDESLEELFRRGNELQLYHESVEMHCLECTGGVPACVTPECKLRPVSPLPLGERYRNVEQAPRFRPLIGPDAPRLVQRVRTDT